MSAPTVAALRRGDCDPYEGTPYEGSPEGWWTPFGGALDVRSGVVFIPPGNGLPACPFPCDVCRGKGRQ